MDPNRFNKWTQKIYFHRIYFEYIIGQFKDAKYSNKL
jgi:hypothetical protein